VRDPRLWIKSFQKRSTTHETKSYSKNNWKIL